MCRAISLERGLTVIESVSEASPAWFLPKAGGEVESQAASRSQGGMTASFYCGNPSVRIIPYLIPSLYPQWPLRQSPQTQAARPAFRSSAFCARQAMQI